MKIGKNEKRGTLPKNKDERQGTFSRVMDSRQSLSSRRGAIKKLWLKKKIMA
jgi:hypothetical protein